MKQKDVLMPQPILIACDGSSHRNGQGGPIGWAWAREDGHWMNDGYFTGSNQTAELWGILSILLFHPKGHLRIQMDSKYALNVAEKWAKSWARKGWVKSDHTPVLNQHLIKPILELTSIRKDPVEYEWVKGHRKDNAYPLNTIADVRAGEASHRAKQTHNFEESATLYRDSKEREFMQIAYDMKKRVYQ